MIANFRKMKERNGFYLFHEERSQLYKLETGVCIFVPEAQQFIVDRIRKAR